MNIEDELRKALRREEPPGDFAARVMARARPVVLPFWRRPAALALAAGLAIAAIVPVTVGEYRKKQTERALEAQREVLMALTITQSKLQRTREIIQRNRGISR